MNKPVGFAILAKILIICQVKCQEQNDKKIKNEALEKYIMLCVFLVFAIAFTFFVINAYTAVEKIRRHAAHRMDNLRTKLRKCIDEIRIIARMYYDSIGARINDNMNGF